MAWYPGSPRTGPEERARLPDRGQGPPYLPGMELKRRQRDPGSFPVADKADDQEVADDGAG